MKPLAMNALMPNGTQMPDTYYDIYLGMLLSEEWKLVSYVARHTFGYKKDSDCIALSQFANGIVKRDKTTGNIVYDENGEPEHVDYGVGMSVPTIRKYVATLVEMGIFRVAPNVETKNLGARYQLESDPEKVKWAEIEHRFNERKTKNAQRRVGKAKGVAMPLQPLATTDSRNLSVEAQDIAVVTALQTPLTPIRDCNTVADGLQPRYKPPATALQDNNSTNNNSTINNSTINNSTVAIEKVAPNGASAATLLVAVEEDELYLFEQINLAREARGYRKIRPEFKTPQQRERFRKANLHFNGRTREIIGEIMGGGALALDRIVNSFNTWRLNDLKPKTPVYGRGAYAGFAQSSAPTGARKIATESEANAVIARRATMGAGK